MTMPLRDIVDAVAAADEALDEAIPPRYRPARARRPDIQSWAAGFQADAEPRSLLILGPTGTGKTWAAYGALRLAVITALRPNRAGVFHVHGWETVTFADFIASMRPSRTGDPEGRMAELRAVPLLMVDDLGIAKATEFTEEVTYRLISGRYDAMLPTIFTSNLPLGQLKEALGDRIASRLAETCTRVVLDGADRRRVAQPAVEQPAPKAGREAAEDTTVRDRSPEVTRLLAEAAAKVGPGKPDQLRYRDKTLLGPPKPRASDEPNPHFTGYPTGETP